LNRSEELRIVDYPGKLKQINEFGKYPCTRAGRGPAINSVARSGMWCVDVIVNE
jgi:hypothetical protein